MASDHLDDDTQRVDDTAHDDGPLAADPVGDITSDEGAEEGTAGQDGDDEGGVGVA